MYRDSLRRQVAERGPVPEEAWGNAERFAVAGRIEDIWARYCWDLHLSFHPDDPLKVVGEFEVGDLSEAEALMAMENVFGVSLPQDLLSGLQTFGDLVDYIVKNMIDGEARSRR